MAADREDLDALRAALGAAEARAQVAETEAARAVAAATRAQAVLTSSEAVIAALKLEILKLRRELYGQKSERKARLLDQLELQIEELEATATEAELRAEQAAARASTPVRTFTRRRPVRKPFPEHLPRERVVIEAPATCGCCGSGRIAKLGEDVTGGLPMARPFDEIARLDRRWFRAHPERRHRCRRPDTRELDLYTGGDGGRLIMAVRHLGRGRVLYQPLMLQGVLPSDERSCAAIFALAVKHRDPIPHVGTLEWLAVRHRLFWLARPSRKSP
jgi:hypothetical protein